MITRRRMAAVLAAVLGMLTLGTGAAVAQVDPPGQREVILVLDTSSSMSVRDLASARDAAQDFAVAVPEDVRVGLVAFAGQPRLVLRPTTDRAALATGLDGLRRGGGTALYDAIALGVSALSDSAAAERRLVVLSDGGDTARRTTLAEAKRLLVDGDVVADFVAYRYGSQHSVSMKTLAAASGGRMLTAKDAAQLAGAFAAIARSAPAPAATPGEAGWTWLPDWSWQVWLIAGMIFSAILAGVLLLFGLGSRPNTGKTVLAQIESYGTRRKEQDGEKPKATSITRATVDWTDGVLRSHGWDEKLAEQLDLASISMKPAEWTVLRLCAGVLAALLFVLIGVHFLIGIAAGFAVGWLGTLLLVRIRIGRRRRAFSDQLPDILQLIAGSLRSGFSLAQALDSVVREDTQPSAGEFSRALAESRIGVELEDTLDRVALRMASDDLKWVVMAIRIQREVGGNLAEVLLTTVGTMRERAQVRRQVRALSAEGRLSAYVLLALPFGIGAFVYFNNPEYIRPLYTTVPGVVMLVASAVLMALGSFWMSRLVKVEV